MIKELMKKYFSAEAEQPAKANQEEEVNMTQELEQTKASADNTAVAELAAQLASQTEQMSTLQAQFAELTANYEAAQAALNASADAQAALVANAKASTLKARTESLSAVMGDVKGPLMAASLEALSDETFATVLSGYVASFEAESKSEMFVEKGVTAEVKPEAVKEESEEMKLIKAQSNAALSAQ